MTQPEPVDWLETLVEAIRVHQADPCSKLYRRILEAAELPCIKGIGAERAKETQ